MRQWVVILDISGIEEYPPPSPRSHQKVRQSPVIDVFGGGDLVVNNIVKGDVLLILGSIVSVCTLRHSIPEMMMFLDFGIVEI